MKKENNFSNAKFISSIVLSAFFVLFFVIACLFFALGHSMLDSGNFFGALIGGFLGTVMFLLVDVVSLVFSLIVFSISIKNFLNGRNIRSTVMFILSLVELLAPIVMAILYFVL